MKQEKETEYVSEYVDQEKSCRECGGAFVYTARDQRFFVDMNYNPPVRCRPCRDKRKAANGGHQVPDAGRELSSKPEAVQATAPEVYRRPAPRYEPQPEPVVERSRKQKSGRRRRQVEDEDSDW